MAEIVLSDSKNGKKSKSRFIRVDMTPMVDLGFLLITFFMFTTNFSKPNVMDLGLPASDHVEGIEIDYRNQITFILGKDNEVFYYQKDIKDLKNSDFKMMDRNGMNVAKLIAEKKKSAPKPEIFTIIIKPTDDSNYKNFVDMLDEMAITKNEKYGIADLQPNESSIYKELTK